MDELEISGKRYISTRRAGKEHGYHSDYIGQLIRGGKVAGQKVGRAWYVEAETLARYLGKEYAAPVVEATSINTLDVVVQQMAPQKVTPTAVEVQTTPIEKVAQPAVDTQPPLQPLTLKDEHHIPIHKPLSVVSEITEPPFQGLTYISDEEPLLPQIHSTQNELRHATTIATYNQRESLPHQTSRRLPVAGAIALAVTGLVVMIVSATASSMISSTIRVEGQTASTYYSFGQ